jgi:hypothetical protein
MATRENMNIVIGKDVKSRLYNVVFSPISSTADLPTMKFFQLWIYCTEKDGTAEKVRLFGNSSIGKVALAAYFHRAHYNSPMALAAHFCRYPALRGISRAVSKFRV